VTNRQWGSVTRFVFASRSTFQPARVAYPRAICGLALCVAAMLLLGGCFGPGVRKMKVTPPAGAQGLAFDVRNARGAVTLRVDPNAEKIRAKARLRDDRFLPWPRREVRRAVEFYPDVQTPIEGRAVANFIVESSRAARDHHVDVAITTPRCEGVRVNAAGPIKLIGVAGAVEAETPQGEIELWTNQPLTEPVTLNTGDGSIFLRISPESTGEFELHAPQGQVTLHSWTTAPHGRSESPHYFTGALNDGANPIVARTQDGDVTVRVMEQAPWHIQTIKRLYK